MEREAQETLAAALAQPEVAAEVRTGRLLKPASYAGFGPLSAFASPSTAAATSRTEPATTGTRGDLSNADAAAAPMTDGLQRQPRTDTLQQRRPPEPKADELQPRRAAQQARERREAAERRLEQARAALAQASRELLDVEQATDAAEHDQALARQRLDAHMQSVHQHEQHVATLEQQLSDLQHQLRQLQQQLRDNLQRRLELEGQLASADGSATVARHQHGQAHTAREAAMRRVEVAEQQLNALSPAD